MQKLVVGRTRWIWKNLSKQKVPIRTSTSNRDKQNKNTYIITEIEQKGQEKYEFIWENQTGKYSAKYIQINALGNIFIGFLGTILGAVDNFVNGNSIKIAFVVVIIGGSIVQRIVANKITK